MTKTQNDTLTIIINQVELELDHTHEDLINAVAKRLSCSRDSLITVQATRRSVDARVRRSQPVFVYTVTAEVKGIQRRKIKDAKIQIITSHSSDRPHKAYGFVNKPHSTPIVTGAGPAGLVAALLLARAGLEPLLIERGSDAQTRSDQVKAFWAQGIHNAESNVLYGEGGAGLFSDGKLSSRSKDRDRTAQFLKILVECGADSDILVDFEPHLGSDKLLAIVQKLRAGIIAAGGRIEFNSRMERAVFSEGGLRALIVNGREIPTEHCILAVGHSSRDMFLALSESGVIFESKPFAVGIRIELPQKSIDSCQWGRFAGHPRLGAASFRLTGKANGRFRACYSFCMCPGGVVVPCASEPGYLTTNGMSYSGRKGSYGNAAFLIPVDSHDFSTSGATSTEALSGIEFQRDIERKAFEAGGCDYSLPACSLEYFITGRSSTHLPESRSWKRSRPADLSAIFPEFVVESLREAIPQMLAQLKITDYSTIPAFAAESRSSSPVRILRDETGQCQGKKGLYPAGEGSGYAGGIVSSAIDGIKVAEALMKNIV